ncbi:hypothetical protein EJB05_01698, partial [Eragrostis curvula]
MGICIWPPSLGWDSLPTLQTPHLGALFFHFAGNMISIMTFLAPIPTFYRICKSKSTEGFQSLPYVVALFSSMLWIYYAMIKSNEILLITVNAAGCVIETVYIAMYLAYAPRKGKVFTATIFLLLNVGVFGLILLLTLLLSTGEKRVVSVGWVCVAFSISVFVAPLSIIVSTVSDLLIHYSLVWRVIRTSSVKYMPFFLSLSLTLSAIVWFVYGLLIKDKYVALPNILGFTFGVIQMGLYVFYFCRKKMLLLAEGKDAAKLQETMEDHVPKKSCDVHPAPEMAATAVPGRSCTAAAETKAEADI